jgi:hypothetical protein
MPLSIQDLLNIQAMPDETELSLLTMASFYEQHLCNRQFLYTVGHAKGEIRLRFKTGDLCHLLGVQHVVKGQQYRGEQGFRAMAAGGLTFDTLKRANTGGYEDMLYRMLYFPFVYQLIQNPKIIIDDRQFSTSIVQAQFVFYDRYGARSILLKLRQEEEGSNFFVPVTFDAVRKVKPEKHVVVKNLDVLGYNDGYE